MQQSRPLVSPPALKFEDVIPFLLPQTQPTPHVTRMAKQFFTMRETQEDTPFKVLKEVLTPGGRPEVHYCMEVQGGGKLCILKEDLESMRSGDNYYRIKTTPEAQGQEKHCKRRGFVHTSSFRCQVELQKSKKGTAKKLVGLLRNGPPVEGVIVWHFFKAVAEKEHGTVLPKPSNSSDLMIKVGDLKATSSSLLFPSMTTDDMNTFNTNVKVWVARVFKGIEEVGKVKPAKVAKDVLQNKDVELGCPTCPLFEVEVRCVGAVDVQLKVGNPCKVAEGVAIHFQCLGDEYNPKIHKHGQAPDTSLWYCYESGAEEDSNESKRYIRFVNRKYEQNKVMPELSKFEPRSRTFPIRRMFK